METQKKPKQKRLMLLWTLGSFAVAFLLFMYSTNYRSLGAVVGNTNNYASTAFAGVFSIVAFVAGLFFLLALITQSAVDSEKNEYEKAMAKMSKRISILKKITGLLWVLLATVFFGTFQNQPYEHFLFLTFGWSAIAFTVILAWNALKRKGLEVENMSDEEFNAKYKRAK